MATAFIALSAIAFLTQGHDPLTLIALLPAAVGLLMVFGLGRSAWIRAGETSISYEPALGRKKSFLRSDVKSIVRVPGARGLARLQFRDPANRRIVSCQESFARSDVTNLAQFLGVTLRWDFGWPSASGGARPSWDEIKAQLSPEELSELEKHMKKPAIDESAGP